VKFHWHSDLFRNTPLNPVSETFASVLVRKKKSCNTGEHTPLPSLISDRSFISTESEIQKWVDSGSKSANGAGIFVNENIYMYL